MTSVRECTKTNKSTSTLIIFSGTTTQRKCSYPQKMLRTVCAESGTDVLCDAKKCRCCKIRLISSGTIFH
jgi:hypothetical protein